MLVIIRSYNFTYTSHVISHIPPKHCKEKETKDKQLCIAVHTIHNNIHDIDPLDKSRNKAHPKQHCFT